MSDIKIKCIFGQTNDNYINCLQVGLGDTLQYNYQAFQRRDAPKFYRDNGHVLLLGQKFTAKTTNQEENAPGGFYKANGPDRYINENFRYVKDRSAEMTMVHKTFPPSKKEIILKVRILEVEAKILVYDQIYHTSFFHISVFYYSAFYVPATAI